MLELGILVGRVRRRIRERVREQLEARGQSISAWAALRNLFSSGPSTQRDLAEATAQHPTQMSRQLAGMEGAGWLRRSRDPADRRCLRVAITGRGRKTLEQGNPAVSAGVADALSALDAADLVALRALLRKVLAVDRSKRSKQSERRDRSEQSALTRDRGPRGTRRFGP
jgi:DNA-binding MarR family transcriptional regulator